MIEKIRACFRNDRVRYSKHAIFEMEHEPLGEILDQEVDEAIASGEEVFQYAEDSPHPSCLIFGRTRNRRPIHMVCGYDEMLDEVIVITVYEPSEDQWFEYRRRRKL